MATYNGEKYLYEQLDSIRCQTMPPDEVIICDDCSKDSTVNMIQKYIDKYQLKHWNVYENEKNKGYSKNFSDALKLAKGDIIFLADQDDIWMLDKIEKMTAIMMSNESIELLASNVKPFYMGSDPRKVNYEKLKTKKEVVKIENKAKWIKPMRPGCSMCFRNNLLVNYDKLWFEDYAHDALLWGMAVLKGTAYLYNKDTINFRRHDTNASSRVEHRNENRVKSIHKEIVICEKNLKYCDRNRKLITKQLNLYRKREYIIEKRKFIKCVLLLKNLKYYARKRYWLTDLYYCLK